MVSKKQILLNGENVAVRSYEVSVWSLQDSFITVLKWAQIDNKGQIQQPELTIDVDGTEEFTFTIPMYLAIGKENPIWHNTLNGNLMMNMRKIKVILNKTLEDEHVFEFMITKVTERHERDQLYCDVACEGMAFHELGKIGYKIALSADEYLLEYEDWFENRQDEEMPRQTIQYWNEKTGFLLPYPDDPTEVVPNKWYYKVEMNWSAYNGRMTRDKHKVYEDEFVASWDNNQNGALVPTAIEAMKEKERPVDIQDSNMYNITQKIAETFGVFCRYEYVYDTNYHIIAQLVIYYNNFIEEQDGHMDLTYPYHTSEITREMDSTELTTKLFIRDSDYEYTDSGKLTIMSADANKSREDYILNFDYLHKFDIITDEQYDAIAEYEITMHDINIKLERIEPQIQNLQNKITDYEAKLKTAENGAEEGADQLNFAKAHVPAVRNDEDGIVHITQNAPKSVMVLTDETDNSYYVKMPFNGIVPATVQLFDGIIDYTKTEKQLENEYTALVFGGILEFDNITDDLIKITHLPKTVTKKVMHTTVSDSTAEVETVDLSKTLWLVCDYIPTTYWTKVRDYWEQQCADIEKQIVLYRDEILPGLHEDLAALEEQQQVLLAEKKRLVREFEEMMGPALREGYWQPENYQDYGNKFYIENLAENPTDIAQYLFCDTQYYDGNNKITFYDGPTERMYLCFEVGVYDEASDDYDTFLDNLEYIKQNYDNLYFIYNDIQALQQSQTPGLTTEQSAQYQRNAFRAIHVGGEDCRFEFFKAAGDNMVRLVLVVEATKHMSEDQMLYFISGEDSRCWVGTIAINDKGYMQKEDGGVAFKPDRIYGVYTHTDDMSPANIGSILYPRIIIDSLNLKTAEDVLKIKLNDTLLTDVEDYTIHVETDLNDDIEHQRQKYMIDIKPRALLKAGVSPRLSISYELSNAATLIYLDALQVAKENSVPQVSYTVKLSMYDPYILHNIYEKLAKIVHINDVPLKFENMQGYISHIEMHLDMPWEDSIEVKNYKTKFEDLFSNIVAQTDAMQKKSHNYDIAATAFTPTGALSSDTVIKMLDANTPIFSTYIDDQLASSPALRGILTNIFNDAGQILGSAGNALNDIRSITSRNSSILAGFQQDAVYGLSQVQINENGIFIGSDQRVSLFSGDITTPDSGVSIDLSPQRLLLGASSGSNSTAAKFTDKYLVLAAGNVIADSETLDENGEVVTDLDTLNVNGTTLGGLVGAKFTSNSIGMATLNEQGTVINSILMNDRGITLGSGKVDAANNQDGINLDQDTNALRLLNITGASYVRVSGSGIDIGSGGELYVNTQNVVINSAATTTNSIFELKKKASDWTAENNKYDTALSYTESGGLTIKGNISADSLVVGDQSTQEQSLSDWVNAKVTPEAIWLGVVKHTTGDNNATIGQETSLSITDDSFSILSSGKFSVNTSNVIINTDANAGESIFKLTDGDLYTPVNYLDLGKDNNDNLYAKIAGWTLEEHKLYSGSDTNYVALDSGTSNEDYAIWAGGDASNTAPFAVLRNGQVYLNKLMVLDPNKELPGSHVQKGSEWFTAIDFSRLNFKQAVSVNGSWSGSNFNVRVSLWGVLNKSVNMSAGVTIGEVTSPGYLGHSILLNIKLTQSINGSEKSEYRDIGTVSVPDSYKNYVWGLAAGKVSYTSGDTSVTVPVSGMGNTGSVDITPTYDAGYNAGYKSGWNGALDKCTAHECYTGGDYYSTLWKAPQVDAPSVSNCRVGQSKKTYYSLPGKIK